MILSFATTLPKIMQLKACIYIFRQFLSKTEGLTISYHSIPNLNVVFRGKISDKLIQS